MPKIMLNIDGQDIEVDDNITVLQACEQAGKEIPRFCYHDRLDIAGNCRMCLVEVEKTPKPQASCAFPVRDGMVIRTNSPQVKKAREGVMEFLLINHPLDCPICDQGGECDLQDQAYFYGKGDNRFAENKRSVADKDFGPLIKTHMTRCIHCTRCIRFSTQIAGVEELGATGRGENMEVGTYITKAISSELSGNIIDLCPVGALTSKPYAFTARSWELRKTETIDILDAVGSNIRVDSKGNEVMRILPRLNEEINEEWISDKTRFAYDGLKMQRVDRPYIKIDGKLIESSWQDAYNKIAQYVNEAGIKIGAIAGGLADVESMYVMRKLVNKLNSESLESRLYNEKLDASNRSSYIFNTSIESIEEADFCLFVGTNLGHDAAIVNARFRKRWLLGNFYCASIGESNFNFEVEQLGGNVGQLKEILSGKHVINKKLSEAKKPMIVLGGDALMRVDGDVILSLAQQIAEKYNMVQENFNGFNVLHRYASRVGALDLGFVQKNGYNIDTLLDSVEQKTVKVLFMLGGDEIADQRLENGFIIYIGHHGDEAVKYADVILPSAAYTEKDATYVNLEGRVQQTRQAVMPPNLAKADWVIVNEIAKTLGIDFAFNDIYALRKEIKSHHGHFALINQISKPKWEMLKAKDTLSKDLLYVQSYNFYMTDPISKSSKTMAECSRLILNKNKLKGAA